MFKWDLIEVMQSRDYRVGIFWNWKVLYSTHFKLRMSKYGLRWIKLQDNIYIIQGQANMVHTAHIKPTLDSNIHVHINTRSHPYLDSCSWSNKKFNLYWLCFHKILDKPSNMDVDEFTRMHKNIRNSNRAALTELTKIIILI